MPLETGAKEALTKAMSAVASGKMKPGDSMVVKGKPSSSMEEVAEPAAPDEHNEGLEEIAGDIANVMGLDPGTAGPLKDLLAEFVDRCMSQAK